MSSQDIASIINTLLQNGAMENGFGTVVICVVIFWLIKGILSPLKDKFHNLAKEETVTKKAEENYKAISLLNIDVKTELGKILRQIDEIKQSVNELKLRTDVYSRHIREIYEIHSELDNLKNEAKYQYNSLMNKK